VTTADVAFFTSFFAKSEKAVFSAALARKPLNLNEKKTHASMQHRDGFKS
jgi:hypothetical protein